MLREQRRVLQLGISLTARRCADVLFAVLTTDAEVVQYGQSDSSFIETPSKALQLHTLDWLSNAEYTCRQR